MPPSPPPPRTYNSPQRAAVAAQTRERIVAAAREQLASAEGLHGFSLDAVARAAKVTRLTVYNQFGSRRALLEAVFDDLASRGGLHRLAGALAQAQPMDGLREMIAVFASFFTGMRLPMEPLLAAAQADPELRESLRERNERRRTGLRALVQRMQAQGLVHADAAEDLVDLLWSLTAPSFFADLMRHGRSAEQATALVQMLAASAVRLAGTAPQR